MAKRNLSQPIFESLSERILHWSYLPGHRLTEEALCEEFNVSRSPVREALNTLVENGLIEKKPGVGYSVKLLDFDEINELYDVRIALETYAIQQICRNGMDEDRLADLRAYWRRIGSQLPDAATAVAAADEEFHELLVKQTGNRTLLAMLKSIDQRIHFVRLADITNEERVRTTCSDHIELLESIAQRDEVRACEAVCRNINGGRRSVEHAIKDALANAYRTRE